MQTAAHPQLKNKLKQQACKPDPVPTQGRCLSLICGKSHPLPLATYPFRLLPPGRATLYPKGEPEYTWSCNPQDVRLPWSPTVPVGSYHVYSGSPLGYRRSEEHTSELQS